MAITAIALPILDQTIEDGQIKLTMSAVYYNTVSGYTEQRAVYAYFSPTATPGQIETAIANAVVEQGKNTPPVFTLLRNDVLMVDIKRAI